MKPLYGCGTTSEERGAKRGPDPDEGAAHHRATTDGTEDAAVRGIAPIVTHHSQAALGDDDPREIEGRGLARQVGLYELPSVHEHVPVVALDRLAGQRDHPLDVLLGRRLGDAHRL